jgi:hypothetical protein
MALCFHFQTWAYKFEVNDAILIIIIMHNAGLVVAYNLMMLKCQEDKSRSCKQLNIDISEEDAWSL